MVTQNLERDSSQSLRSSRGWLMLVGLKTFPVQHERRTKAMLEAAFDFLSCLVVRGHWRGENPGQRQSLRTHPFPPAPARLPALLFLFPVDPEVILPSTLRPAGMSHPAPVLVISAAVNLINYFSEPH